MQQLEGNNKVLATALETPATQDDMAMRLEAAGKRIAQLKKEATSKDARITQLESENANLTADLEVLKCKQTAWTNFMYENKKRAATMTLIEDMPWPMQQSLHESFQRLDTSMMMMNQPDTTIVDPRNPWGPPVPPRPPWQPPLPRHTPQHP